MIFLLLISILLVLPLSSGRETFNSKDWTHIGKLLNRTPVENLTQLALSRHVPEALQNLAHELLADVKAAEEKEHPKSPAPIDYYESLLDKAELAYAFTKVVRVLGGNATLDMKRYTGDAKVVEKLWEKYLMSAAVPVEPQQIVAAGEKLVGKIDKLMAQRTRVLRELKFGDHHLERNINRALEKVEYAKDELEALLAKLHQINNAKVESPTPSEDNAEPMALESRPPGLWMTPPEYLAALVDTERLARATEQALRISPIGQSQKSAKSLLLRMDQLFMVNRHLRGSMLYRLMEQPIREALQKLERARIELLRHIESVDHKQQQLGHLEEHMAPVPYGHGGWHPKRMGKHH